MYLSTDLPRLHTYKPLPLALGLLIPGAGRIDEKGEVLMKKREGSGRKWRACHPPPLQRLDRWKTGARPYWEFIGVIKSASQYSRFFQVNCPPSPFRRQPVKQVF